MNNTVMHLFKLMRSYVIPLQAATQRRETPFKILSEILVRVFPYDFPNVLFSNAFYFMKPNYTDIYFNIIRPQIIIIQAFGLVTIFIF